MPLRYEDYAARVPAGKLEQELDAMHGGVEKHLTAIARVLLDLEYIAPELDLHPSDLQDLDLCEPPKKKFVKTRV